MIDKSCNTEEIVYDLSTWCSKADCSIQTLSKNLLAKVFQATGAINQIIEFLSAEEDTQDTAAVFAKYESIGGGIGRMLRLIYNFQK
jgi:hypothetical protein